MEEKKQKRIVKTPFQVEALEKFYNEHKYPNESMKNELAASIGLTEKQVSGWFCHRRLKDKKSPNDESHAHGKQDRSSGVIQDRGSGLRQDSCGSTKQGDFRNRDPKEVESRRLTAEGLLHADPRYELGTRHYSSIDDTSSGSSSPLEDAFLQQNVGHLGAPATRYPVQTDAMGVKVRTGPSGYLKVKGQAENAAITAVKRQLGRHYREDGPSLGIEFEPLPPGAFETPPRDPVNEACYAGESTPIHSLEASRTFQQPNSGKMYERYSSKSNHTPEFDDTNFKMTHGPKNREKYLDHQYKQTPMYPPCMPFPERNLQKEVNGDSAGEASVRDIRENFEMRTKHGAGLGVRQDSLSSHHLPPYAKKIDNKQAEHRLRNSDHIAPKRERREPKSSSLTLKRGEVLEMEDQRLHKKIAKEGEFYEERRGRDTYHEQIQLKIQPETEMKVAKRIREELPHQWYSSKESTGDVPPWTSKDKRSAAEIPSSFSEDETAETSSSGN